jgi:hypothetical protein
MFEREILGFTLWWFANTELSNQPRILRSDPRATEDVETRHRIQFVSDVCLVQ